ncbi:MAG: thiamine pyrophosphate-binding protein [Clostridiales bacterium]|nr:thiamine pyrophosphate-binding protein [Clostridiales bacterium]
MKIKLSDYIAEFLVKNGVTDLFTVTGGGAMHLNDSFGHHPKLHCTYDHHEQACAIAAESYARLTRKIAAVCVTSGPGGTNAITGVMGGWLDSVPMFVISGQVKRATTITAAPELKLRQLGDQEFNIIDCAKVFTKYAVFVNVPEDIAYHLERAWYLAMSGRPGPVWLDIPLDVQASIIETDELRHYDRSEDNSEIPPEFTSEQADEIIEKIKSSKRPVIFGGSGVRIGGAYDKFLKLIENLNIPVVTPWNAHDLLWDDHPLYCGRPGTVGTRGGNFVVQNADLLISFGCRLNIRQISYNYTAFAEKAYKIIIDIDKAELDKPTLSPDMKIHADVADVIDVLLETGFKNDDPDHKKWLDWCRNVDKKYPAARPEFFAVSKPLNPYAFMRKLSEHLDENEITVTGNGSACVVSFQSFVIKKGQRLYTNSGCASMGYGTPAALGAAVAVKSEGKRVICLDGDGSFQMNIQELQTIVYNRFNIKLFYLNNNGYHSIRQTQTNLFKPPMYGVSPDNGVSFPDMEKISAAYGLPYFLIDSLENIDEKIDEVLRSDGPVICEAVLDPAQFFEPKLSSRVLPDGTIVSPSLEDMYPFLPRDEFESNIIK